MDKLDMAIIFAVEAHSGAKRKGKETPFIFHPLEVVSILGTLTNDKDLMAAAVLHDVIEDTEYTEEDILNIFGEKILNYVLYDTEDKMLEKPATESWIERKQATIDFLDAASKEAQILCLSDKLANLREICRDYKVKGEELWKAFHQTDKKMHGWYYKSIADRLTDLTDTWAYKEYVSLIKEVFDL